MSITVGTIIGRVRNQLLDTDNTAYAWSDAELIDYLAEANDSIVFVKPDANAVTATMTPVAGVLQSIPADGQQFLDAIRNITSGAGIRMIDRDHLVNADPNWAAASKNAVDAKHYMTDARNPKKFYLYPGNDGTGSIEILYAASPTRVANLTDAFPLPDTYEGAARAYVCHLAFMKNTKRYDPGKSVAFYNEFQTLMGGKTSAQFQEAPPKPQVRET